MPDLENDRKIIKDYLDSHKPVRAPADAPIWIFYRLASCVVGYDDVDPLLMQWMRFQIPR